MKIERAVPIQDTFAAYEGVIDRFVVWAQTQDAIRAAAVIGSRARTDHPADEWADLDIVIWCTNREPYLADGDWAAAIGEPWISFVETSPDPGVLERRVLFAGGLDVDFAFIDPQAAQQPRASPADQASIVFGRGVRVLLDRDGLVADMLAALRPAMPPAPPDVADFDRASADFWYHAVWTAKHLRRGELWWAKGGCDGRLKELLCGVLEWEAAANGRDRWFRGRFLEQWADPATVAGLPRAFAHYDEDDVWAALAVTMDLFARVSRQLATNLGLPYPEQAEARSRELVQEYASTR